MAEKKIVVQTIDLTKVYGDGVEVKALDAVNLTIAEGEFVAVVGPSGSGKSTLLNLIGALDRPTSGQIIIGGQDLAQVSDLDQFRSRTVGFIFQLHNLIPTLTSRENVEVPMHETTGSGAARHTRAMELLAMVNLGERANFLPSQLSGGERQRVAIARALANRPVLLLADEPTGNLDSKSTAEIMALLRELNQQQGATIIVVTHNPIVARATRRIVTLRDGRIQRDQLVVSPYLADLRDFKESSLGKVLREGTLPDEVAALGLDEVAQPLAQVLERV